jgi:signal transduction histidine kinase
VAGLLQEHADDLPGFFANEPRGAKIPGFLASIGKRLRGEQATLLAEMHSLTANVDHIKEIVAMQQGYARVAGVVEVVAPAELIEDALRLNAGSMERHGIELVRDFAEVPPIELEKHKAIQVLVNLIRNAQHACDDGGREGKRICLRIGRTSGGGVKLSVEDNGIGIPPENLTRIFAHGFTTRRDGHGWGLHSGALAARELGGSLQAASDGPGCGATFTLELPLDQKPNLA